jgi:hypothetical protein
MAAKTRTADPLRPRNPKPSDDDHTATRERWSRQKKAAFDALDPVAVCLVATDGPVSVTLHNPDGSTTRIGHNRGIWPAKAARTGSWRDTVTERVNQGPLFWVGVQHRLWFGREKDAREMLALLGDSLARMHEEHQPLGDPVLMNGFTALNPELDMDLYCDEIEDLAHRAKLAFWTDGDLSDLLDREVERAMALARVGIRADTKTRGRA